MVQDVIITQYCSTQKVVNEKCVSQTHSCLTAQVHLAPGVMAENVLLPLPCHNCCCLLDTMGKDNGENSGLF